MATGTKVCRVCGKEYPYCHTEARDKFRWQDVACSPECGEKYFAAIKASRSKKKAVPEKKAPSKVDEVKEPKVEATLEDIVKDIKPVEEKKEVVPTKAADKDAE